jgi:chromate transporter
VTVARASGASPTDGSHGGPTLVPCTLRDYCAYFLRLGTVGFGGPIALAGYMQKDLVEDRRWITKEDYVEGLALAQLAPGPLAAQLAIYLGWVRGRVLGATLVGVAFVLPSFVMVLALSAVYVRFGGISWMQGAFYGVGAAVIGIIARSVVKLCKMTLARDRFLWALFILNGVLTAWTESEVVWAFAISGVLSALVKARGRGVSAAALLSVSPLPIWLVSGLHGAATASLLGKILWFFAEAGAFVFGSGLAIVPFLYGGVVDHYHWLTDRQFLDAVAVAMITPGPVVITVAFIGYLVAGPLGSAAAAVGTFLPCYLFTVVPAPYFRRYARNPTINAFVSGVSAAATGAIAGAAFVLGKRALIDVPTWLICGATLAVVSKVKKAPEPLVILAAGVIGLVLRTVLDPK